MGYALDASKPTCVWFHLGTNCWVEKPMAVAFEAVRERFGDRVQFKSVDVSSDDDLAAQDLCDAAESPVRGIAVFAPGDGSAWAWSGPGAAELVVARLEELLEE